MAKVIERAWNSKLGRFVTRAEWEANHKPTCNVYPCKNWPEIHWHIFQIEPKTVSPTKKQ